MKRNKGISIVEGVVYMAILALFTAVVMYALVGFSQSYRKLRTARIISSSGAISLDRVIREIRTANAVDLSGSVLDSDQGRITLSTTDENGLTQSVSFVLEEGLLMLYENGVPIGPLTSSAASTTQAKFSLSTNPHSSAVRVQLTIRAGAGDFERTETFYGGAQLRNSI